MRWFMYGLALFLVVSLQAQKTVYFEENIGTSLYKKCTSHNRENREKITEESYILPAKQKNATLIYKNIFFFYKKKPVRFTIEDYRGSKTTTYIEVKKKNIAVKIVQGKKETKTSLTKPQNLHFPSSYKMYNHPYIFQTGKKFSVNLPHKLPHESTINFIEHEVEILPPTTLPDKKKGKKYFVAKITEKKLKENSRTTYYDKNGYIVHSIAKFKNISSIRKRISKKNGLIFSQLSYQLEDIEPRATNFCSEIAYSHDYPKGWRKEKVDIFHSMYKGKSGFVGVFINEDLKIANTSEFLDQVLQQMKAKKNSQKESYIYNKIESSESRKVVLGTHTFEERIVRASGDFFIKYYLILGIKQQKQNVAIVLYGTEKQFKKNWPTWYDILHSFLVKK